MNLWTDSQQVASLTCPQESLDSQIIDGQDSDEESGDSLAEWRRNVKLPWHRSATGATPAKQSENPKATTGSGSDKAELNNSLEIFLEDMSKDVDSDGFIKIINKIY